MEQFLKQKLEEWYQLYSEDIYRYVLMIIGDEDKAKDLTHDTFLKAYNSLYDFQGKTSDKNWLYHIARNITIDEIRKKKPIRFALESFIAISFNTSCPDQILQLGENEELLYRSLHKLKRSYREVIILRKIKELSIQETAEILEWKESKVKMTLHRGLSALKKQMIKEGYEHETD